ncbi:non-oxidative hydroxyarylic acid decarboxylases subunit D [Alicyclobacillus acidiphilus]|uniref:non-oxidative hydroxyarylic acid decarboxylases subunit D n=1 Tax=Alicyclobacillus acidiphilus TaxID=182455 RepID=UPI0009FACA6E|nr:non-oxidative hydroxyarylic acid decarboxylases subunit D [Alicyclobacillus acidiphilus]
MSTCPRCDSKEAGKVSDSPVSGAWTIYACPVCFYTWRSSEDPKFTSSSLYNPDFKVRQADIPKAIHVPEIAQRK